MIIELFFLSQIENLQLDFEAVPKRRSETAIDLWGRVIARECEEFGRRKRVEADKRVGYHRAKYVSPWSAVAPR